MAKRVSTKAPPAPLSQETRDEVLRQVHASSEPLTAQALVALLVAPHALTEKQLAPLMDEFAAQGDIHIVPPLKAKGKPRFWGQDYSAAIRASVQAEIETAHQPLTAAELTARLQPRLKLTEAEILPILTELTELKRLRLFPTEKAKGKPRYWNRDLAEIAKAALDQLFPTTTAPLTAKELAAALSGPIKFTEADLEPILEAAVESRALHRFPGKTAAAKPRYWNRDLIEAARHDLIMGLEKQGVLAEAALKKLVKSLTATQFQDALHGLLADGRIVRHPALPGSRTVLFSTRPPSPDGYLREITAQLTKIMALLQEVHVPESELRRAMIQMIDATGISYRGGSSTPSDVTASSPGNSTVAGSSPAGTSPPVDLLDLMKRLEPGAERGALVGARDLRKHVALGKSEFDEHVLNLARDGRVSLHRHDFAHGLSPAERDELISDGDGTYYIGVAIRQS